MKVRDLLKMEIDVDVYDDVCEELAICFCGPCELTPVGNFKFMPVLDLEVEPYFENDHCVIRIDDEEDFVWEYRLELCKLLFEGFAGYMNADDWKEYFKED